MSKDDTSVHILRKLVVDGFLLGGLTACIFMTNLLWEPFERGFFCGDESLMFPYKDDTVTVLMLRGFGLGLPIIAVSGKYLFTND
ncbi:hypothetical protein O3G_MSEX000182 [Manduca sexta]|nr:hypothetical protein O3G_MSEX000182 [Manduca sexta]